MLYEDNVSKKHNLIVGGGDGFSGHPMVFVRVAALRF